MTSDAIDPAAVRHALRAIRYAKPLADSPLLDLRALSLFMRQQAVADSPKSRLWALGRWLDAFAWHQLSLVRGHDRPTDRDALSPDRELELLETDFRQGNLDLEAWSLLSFRYFGAARPQMEQLATRLGVSGMTLRRRLSRGHQLLADALRQAERNASGAALRRHNIPLPLSRFVGREREMADVRALLARHRLVTLTGLGGIGKSRLAMEVARALAPDYPHGGWLVELHALSDPRLVSQQLAAALDLREEAGRPLVETLARHLASRRLLLVLDNCEHLLTACAELCAELLPRCPEVQVLATSRESLGVDGEAVWSVPPLSRPSLDEDVTPAGLVHFDAARLFADRATAARPGFEISGDAVPTLVHVCDQLDGIPLALELAAVRMRTLSLDEIAGRLDDRFRLLSRGPRTARAQHQTLQATVDWSYELLTEPEQVLFARLSVFRGGWTLGAAQAVCSGGRVEADQVPDLLDGLAAKSLATVSDHPEEKRYRVLETIRQYATDMLKTASGGDEARDRHLQFYLELTEEAHRELNGPNQEVWLERLQVEHDNVRAALSWAHARGKAPSGLRMASNMSRFWQVRGYWDEGQAALSRLLALPSAQGDTEERAIATTARGHLLRWQGRFDDARLLYEERLRISQALGDARRIAVALNSLGTIAIDQADFTAAREYLNEALSVAELLTPELQRSHRANILNAIGAVDMRLGDLDAARTHLEECASLYRELGDEFQLGIALGNLGALLKLQGDIDAATACYEDSLEIARRLKDHWGIAATLERLGIVAHERDDGAASRACFVESLGVARRRDASPIVASGLCNFGNLACDEGKLDEAEQMYAESLALAREMGDGVLTADVLIRRGHLAGRRGDDQAAEVLILEGLTIHDRLGVKEGIVAALELLGCLEVRRGKPGRAARLLGAADAMHTAMGSPADRAQQAKLEEAAAAAREALGEDGYRAGFVKGGAMTTAAAAAYALGEVTGSSDRAIST